MNGKAVTVAAIVVLSSCSADIRNVFAGLTYPKEKPPLPALDLDLQIYSIAQLELLTAYQDPRAVAKCLTSVPTDELETLAAKVSIPNQWKDETMHVFDLGGGDCKSLSTADLALARYSLSRFLMSVFAHIRETRIDGSHDKGPRLSGSAFCSRLRVAEPAGPP